MKRGLLSEKKFNIAIMAIMMICCVVLASVPALAVPIVFNLGYGGTVSYAGGSNPFTTTNGLVTFVSNGTTTLSITNGDLDFSTGNYTGGAATSTGFVNYYASGGTVNIAGNAGSGLTTLMTGSFANSSTFDCCTGSFSFYQSSFNGLLNVSYVDESLANALGFVLPPTGGALAQLQIYFGSSPTGPGVGFTGTQMGGAVNVTDTAKVPEPASLLFLGSGLIGLGIFGRKLMRKG